MGTNYDGPKFDASSFTLPNRWWDGLWGGGHTRETDPVTNGWRAVLSKKGGSVLIIGRRGQKGCASVMQLLGGRVMDVCVYAGITPEEAARAVNLPYGDAGREILLDPVILRLEPISGWGLYVLDAIHRERANESA